MDDDLNEMNREEMTRERLLEDVMRLRAAKVP